MVPAPVANGPLTMKSPVAEILEASVTLDALKKRIDETVRTRDRGPHERERWSSACEEFHRRYPTLFYPGGDESLDALKRHDSAAIATALDFLDADPMHFRSGYTKEEVWRRLRRAPLTPVGKIRLEEIALRYLMRRVEREFWQMARVMSKLGSKEFWNTAAKLAESPDEPVKSRASYLLQYRLGVAAGEAFRQKLSLERLMQRYRDR
jgi:hypothetical protein